MLQSKALPVCTTIKRTAIERFNQKNCQGVPQPKELQGIATIIKRIARVCYTQNDFKGVSQVKELPSCVTIKGN